MASEDDDWFVSCEQPDNEKDVVAVNKLEAAFTKLEAAHGILNSMNTVQRCQLAVELAKDLNRLKVVCRELTREFAESNSVDPERLSTARDLVCLLGIIVPKSSKELDTISAELTKMASFRSVSRIEEPVDYESQNRVPEFINELVPRVQAAMTRSLLYSTNEKAVLTDDESVCLIERRERFGALKHVIIVKTASREWRIHPVDPQCVYVVHGNVLITRELNELVFHDMTVGTTKRILTGLTVIGFCYNRLHRQLALRTQDWVYVFSVQCSGIELIRRILLQGTRRVLLLNDGRVVEYRQGLSFRDHERL
jgi:hypothetical protein